MESTNVGTQIMPNANPCIISPAMTNNIDLGNETGLI